MIRRLSIRTAVSAAVVFGALAASIGAGVGFAEPNPHGVYIDRGTVELKVFTAAKCSISKRDGFVARSNRFGARLNVHIQPFHGFGEYPLEAGVERGPIRQTFVDFIDRSGQAFASDYAPPYPVASLGAIKFSDDGKLIGVAFQPMFNASGSDAVIVTGVMVCHYPKKHPKR